MLLPNAPFLSSLDRLSDRAVSFVCLLKLIGLVLPLHFLCYLLLQIYYGWGRILNRR